MEKGEQIFDWRGREKRKPDEIEALNAIDLDYNYLRIADTLGNVFTVLKTGEGDKKKYIVQYPEDGEVVVFYIPSEHGAHHLDGLNLQVDKNLTLTESRNGREGRRVLINHIQNWWSEPMVVPKTEDEAQ